MPTPLVLPFALLAQAIGTFLPSLVTQRRAVGHTQPPLAPAGVIGLEYAQEEEAELPKF